MKITQGIEDVIGRADPPPAVENIGRGDPTGATGINTLLTNGISLIFTFSTIIFVFMVLWAAYDFIFSFGDKEAVSKARSKMTWAIGGYIILSLSFVIFRIIEGITGIQFVNIGANPFGR